MTHPSFHFHSCPECHRVEPCGQGCTIEPDLGTSGVVPFGTHTECSVCLERTNDAFASLRAVSDAVDVMTLMQMYAEAEVERRLRLHHRGICRWCDTSYGCSCPFSNGDHTGECGACVMGRSAR